jgi:hypothetical protein
MAKVMRRTKQDKGKDPIAWDDETVRGDRYGDAAASKDGWNPAWGVSDTESVHPKGGKAKSGLRKKPKKDESRLKDDEAAPSGIEYGTKRKRTFSNY